MKKTVLIAAMMLASATAFATKTKDGNVMIKDGKAMK